MLKVRGQDFGIKAEEMANMPKSVVATPSPTSLMTLSELVNILTKIPSTTQKITIPEKLGFRNDFLFILYV